MFLQRGILKPRPPPPLSTHSYRAYTHLKLYIGNSITITSYIYRRDSCWSAYRSPSHHHHDSAWEKETNRVVSVRGYFIVSADGHNGHDDIQRGGCAIMRACICALFILFSYLFFFLFCFVSNEFTERPAVEPRFIDPQACVHNERTYTEKIIRKKKMKIKQFSCHSFFPMIHGVVVANIYFLPPPPIMHRHFSSPACVVYPLCNGPTDIERLHQEGGKRKKEEEEEKKRIDPSSVALSSFSL